MYMQHAFFSSTKSTILTKTSHSFIIIFQSFFVFTIDPMDYVSLNGDSLLDYINGQPFDSQA